MIRSFFEEKKFNPTELVEILKIISHRKNLTRPYLPKNVEIENVLDDFDFFDRLDSVL